MLGDSSANSPTLHYWLKDSADDLSPMFSAMPLIDLERQRHFPEDLWLCPQKVAPLQAAAVHRYSFTEMLPTQVGFQPSQPVFAPPQQKL